MELLIPRPLDTVKDEEECAEEGRHEHPADVMEHEGQVEGILLAVVVCNQVDGLKVVYEGLTEREHVPDELVSVLVETLDDLVLLARVRHKVFEDHVPVD